MQPKTPSKKVKKSTEYLIEKYVELSKHSSVYDMVDRQISENGLAGDKESELRFIRAVLYHLGVVASSLRKDLWSNNVFIGYNAVVDLVFDCVCKRTDDIVGTAIRTIEESGVHAPGAVVYPLHSFGIGGLGLFYPVAGESATADILMRRSGFCLASQTNSKSRSIHLLRSIFKNLGIRKRPPRDLIEHYCRSRPIEWLYKNPLAVIKMSSFTGTYYETQKPLIVKLRCMAAIIYILSVLQDKNNKEDDM